MSQQRNRRIPAADFSKKRSDAYVRPFFFPAPTCHGVAPSGACLAKTEGALTSSIVIFKSLPSHSRFHKSLFLQREAATKKPPRLLPTSGVRIPLLPLGPGGVFRPHLRGAPAAKRVWHRASSGSSRFCISRGEIASVRHSARSVGAFSVAPPRFSR